MRIRGYDEETQEYSNDVEILSGKIADLTKTASTPGGISLFTDDTKTEFKSTYQLLEEISEIYDQLSDKDQASLLEVIAGKRQGQIVAATINNFDAAREALDNMANSAGNADKEMAVIQQSLEYKVNRLKETGTGIAQNLFQRDDMKGLVDFATGFLNIIDAITEKLGLFGTIGVSVGIGALIKNFSALKTLFTELGSVNMTTAFSSVKNIENLANTATGALNPATVEQYVAALEGLSLKQAQLVLSTTNLSAAQKEQVLTAAGLVASETTVSAALATEAMAQAGLSTETRALVLEKAGLTTATATCTAAKLTEALATAGVSAADIKAIISAMGLTTANTAEAFSFSVLAASIGETTAAMIAFLATNPVFWAMLAVGAIVGVNAALSKQNQAVEEARQAAQEASSTFTESTKSLDDYASKIEELNEKLSSGTLTDAEAYAAKKELLGIQNELKESYGEQAAGIDLVNGKLDEEIAKVKDLSKADANTYLNKNYKAIQEAEKEMAKTLGGDGYLNVKAGKIIGKLSDNYSAEANKIKEIAAKYKDNIELDYMGDGTVQVRFVGDANDATTVLNDFMTDVRTAQDELKDTRFIDDLFSGSDVVVSDNLKNIVDKYDDYLNIDDLGDGQIKIRYVGDAEDAESVLDNLKKDVESVNGTLDMQGILDGAGSVVSEANEIIEKYKDIYDAAQKAKLIADEKDYFYNGASKSAAKWLNDYADAVQKYNDALLSGDTTKISETKNQFESIDTAIQELLKGKSFSEYESMFDEVRNQLDEASAAYAEFSNQLSGNNFDNSSKSIKEYADTLKSVEGGLTDIDFAEKFLQGLGTDEVSQAIQAIVDAYADLGLISTQPTQEEIEGLTDTLVKAGVLTHDATNDVTNDVKEFSSAFEGFQNMLNDTEEGSFSKSLDTYTDKLDTLKESLEKFNEGDLTESDITTLIRQFPQLINYADDMGTGIQSLIDEIINVGDSSTGAGSLVDFFANAIAQLGGESTEAGAAMAALRDQIIGFYNAANNGGVKINIDTETSKFSNMYSAVKNSRSATGLTNDDISNIKSMYSGLQSYDPSKLFERTENGIHLNTKALRELESEYEQVNKNEISSKLRELRTQLQSLGDTESAEKSKIEAQIDSLEILQSQYEGLTSTYNKWIQAQSSGNERDMYESINEGKETIQSLIDRGWIGSDEVRQYIDLISGKDLSTASIEELMSAWKKVNSTIEGTNFTAFDFFTKDSDGNSTTDGIYNFFDAVNQTMGDGYVKVEKTMDQYGNEIEKYSFDFSDGKGKEVAEKLGLDAEYIQAILRAAIDAGFDVNLESAWEQDLDSVVETVQDKRAELEPLGTDPIEINLDVNAGADGDTSAITTEIEKVTAEIERINETPVELRTEADTKNLEYYQEALNVLNQKKIEAEQPGNVSIDASPATASMSECLQKIKEYKTAENELNALKLNPIADTTQITAAVEKVKNAAQAIQNLPTDVKIKIGIEGEDSVDTIIEKMATLDPETEIFLNVDTSDSVSNATELKETIDGIEGKDIEIGITVNGLEDVQSLKDAIDSLADGSVSATATVTGTTEAQALKEAIDTLYSRSVVENAIVTGTVQTKALKTAIDSLYSKTVSERALVYGTGNVQALKRAIDSLYSRTVTTTHITNNIINNITHKIRAPANGTATAIGAKASFAFGSAFADGISNHRSGDWSIKGSGVAFGGELGQELVVRDGHFFTIGDKSAEFFQYKKGDIKN